MKLLLKQNYLNLFLIFIGFIFTMCKIFFEIYDVKYLRQRSNANVGRTYRVPFHSFSRAGNNSIHFYVAIVMYVSVVGWQMF